jgi:hypothetical protein
LFIYRPFTESYTELAADAEDGTNYVNTQWRREEVKVGCRINFNPKTFSLIKTRALPSRATSIFRPASLRCSRFPAKKLAACHPLFATRQDCMGAIRLLFQTEVTHPIDNESPILLYFRR